MKHLRLLAPVLIGAFAFLAGCGDGSVKSPTFTPQLIDLALSTTDTDATDESGGLGTQFSVPAGRPVTLSVLGTFTTPPGSPTTAVESPVTDASFEVSPSANASVSGGDFVGTQVGSLVTVTAISGDERSNTLTFRIVAPVLDSIAITPTTATLAVGGSQLFNVTGTFSDGTTRPVTASFMVQPMTGAVNLSSNSGTSTRATAIPGSQGQNAVLTATDPTGSAQPVTATITISDEFLTALTAIRPANPAIAVGETVDFTAVGTYENSSGATRTGDVDDSLVSWSSANTAAATINADTGVATGVTGGLDTVITVTLDGASPPSSVTTTLTVTNSTCTGPLLQAQGATAVGSTSGVCLLCTVGTPEAAIDASATTFASINVVAGLLNGTATLTTNGSTPFAGGTVAGFVVAQPAGLLLSAELLSTLTVSTVDAAGALVETGAAVPQPGTLIPQLPLTVTLLGAVGAQDTALVSFQTTAGTPYTGVALTFNGGVVSLLPTVNVFQACGTIVPPAAPAP